MASTVEPRKLPVPTPTESPGEETAPVHDRGYLVVCWNDPINLMGYVIHVFQQVFGWTREKAERHMWEVHREGRSILVRESFEKAEFHVHQLQAYSLNATLEPEDA